MTDAKRDSNYVTSMLFVGSDGDVHPAEGDQTTGRLLVDNSGGGSGTVTTVSVVTANGFAGSVADATTTPAITLSTTATGMLKGNGTAISGVTATTNEIAYWSDANTIASLTTATYPSLTELSYVKGVTSAIQTQITAKMTNPMTTGGDIIYGGASGVPTRLANGSAGQVLTSGGTTVAPTWETLSSGGNVSNTGTPANNQIAVWTDATTIEGTSGLTYDGSNFLLTGDIGATATRITKGWFTDLEVTNAIAGSITGNAATVTNATFTTALTVNTGTLTLTANADNTSVLTIGSGAVSVSGSNTGDQTLSSLGAASIALDNLASVAINTSLISDTDGTDSIGSTGVRWLKGWFDDMETTNMPTVGGTAILSSLTAPSFTTSVTVPQVFNADNAIAASGNAATVTRAYRNNVVTNNSAATLTITMSTTSAAGGDMVIVQILDASAVAQTITWVNTEDSEVSAPTTSNGSTTLPLTVGFKWNTLTSKWRCIASA